jgi:hypothetical protein
MQAIGFHISFQSPGQSACEVFEAVEDHRQGLGGLFDIDSVETTVIEGKKGDIENGIK